MLLSIIIPIYGVEQYLESCLNSLINQKGDFEILMIDDGSKDRSGEIAKSYLSKDDRCKYFYKVNGGLSDARNYGLSKANGEYIFFVDADDVVAVNAVESITNALSDKPDCVVFDVKYFWENVPNKEKIVKGVIDIDCDIKRRLLASAPSAWNKVFKRESLLKHPEPKGRYYEDLATTPKIILECEKINYIEEALYFYRQREGSIIYSFNEKCFDLFKDFEEIIAFFQENNQFEQYYDILEYLVIEHLLLYGNKRFIKMPNPLDNLKRSRAFADDYFKDILNNKYYKNFSFSDKLFVKLAYKCKLNALNFFIGVKQLIK